MKLILSAAVAATLFATAASAVTTALETDAGSGGFPTGKDYANAAGATKDDGSLRNDLGNALPGENQIIGDLRGEQDDVADWFYFTVRTGEEIVSATIMTELMGMSVSNLMGVIKDEDGGTIASVSFTAGGTANYLPSGSGPLGAGTYNFGLFFAEGISTPNLNWTITSQVNQIAPVPLPAGLPLLLAGLGGLAVLRWRR